MYSCLVNSYDTHNKNRDGDKCMLLNRDYRCVFTYYLNKCYVLVFNRKQKYTIKSISALTTSARRPKPPKTYLCKK